MPRLPTHCVGARAVTKGAQPGTRLFLKIREDRLVVLVVELLVRDENLGVRMVAVNDLGQVFAQADEHGAVGFAPVALATAAVATGEPDAKCMDVQAYRTLLDATIDKILEKQKYLCMIKCTNKTKINL